MKKSDLFLILGLVVVVILGFFVMKGESLGKGGTFELTYKEYQEKIDDDEKFVVVVERATCSHCVTYMPIVKQFARSKDIKVYYVDTDTFSEKDWEKFEKSNSFFIEKEEEGWGTPTTIFLDGEDAVDYIVGVTTSEELENYYTKYEEYFEKVEE